MVPRSPRFVLPAVALLGVLLLGASAARAAGVVTNCSDDTDLSSKLAGGGSITFSCGPATIVLSGMKTVTAATTIDGGDAITLSGNNQTRLFFVDSGASLDLKNIVLEKGKSDADGGAVYNAGFLALDSATIRDSVAALDGGAIGTAGASDITDSMLLDNQAAEGGALLATGASAQVTIASSVVTGNKASSADPMKARGGAIVVTNGAMLNVFGSEISSNTSGRSGGGITSEATILLSGVHMSGNNAIDGDGGAVYNKGTATLMGSTLESNQSFYGGGIANDHGTLTLTDVTLHKNTANVAGGGGVGSFNGPLTLTNVTVSENTAEGDAGGVENGHGTATLTNVTISGNFATSAGGMSNLFGGTANLTNVTFSKNRAFDHGSGIANVNDPGTHLNLQNVLIGNGIDAPNCDFEKAPESSVANLSDDGSCGFGVGRDGVNAKLGPLDTNGGPTLTHRLLPGSPAIDGGANAGCPSTDQRGEARIQGAACDVGALEFEPCASPTLPIIVSPRNKAKVATPMVPLDWELPDCAKTWSVTVRLDSKRGTVVFQKEKLKASRVTTGPLPSGHSYFWHVAACKGQDCSEMPNWSKFRIKVP